MKKILTLMVFMVTVLSGCASVPMAPPAEDAKAKQFQPTKGKGAIYLYRNENFGGAIAVPVTFNGDVVGKTAPKTFFYWEVTPGKHEITSLAENTESLSLEVKAGKSYFVWQEIKMGMWQPRTKLHLMDQSAGIRGVNECRLAQAK